MTEYQYQSPKQIVASGRYPFSMGQMRHFLLHRYRNGLRSAVRKIGKRIVVRMDLFDHWIEQQAQKERAYE